MDDMFIFNLFKSLAIMTVFGAIFGVIGFIVLFFVESKNIRENYSHYSTTLGNALFLIQNIFEPQPKFRTEQIIWVKKRRTPAEKKVLGLSELHYDKILIRGIKSMKNKRYYLKS